MRSAHRLPLHPLSFFSASVLALAACSGPAAPPPNPPVVAAPAPECPPNAKWDGKACAPVAACGAGTQWDGAKCAPVMTADAACPPGAKPGDPGCPAAAAAVADAPAPPAPPAKGEAKCPDGMALVPGGEMVLAARREKVQLAAYCMDKLETTADQYAACVKAGKCTDAWTKCSKEATLGVEGKGSHPMVCVDFPQAEAYCAAQSKRLPTEAEWEWAARGPEQRTFPWGNDKPTDQLCWSGGGSVRTGTCPAGAFPKGATPEGILDLGGSVLEWTTNKNDKTAPVRVARGGSWKDGVREQVLASRPGGFKPEYRCGFLGIRCVVEAPPELAGKTAAKPEEKKP